MCIVQIKKKMKMQSYNEINQMWWKTMPKNRMIEEWEGKWTERRGLKWLERKSSCNVNKFYRYFVRIYVNHFDWSSQVGDIYKSQCWLNCIQNIK